MKTVQPDPGSLRAGMEASLRYSHLDAIVLRVMCLFFLVAAASVGCTAPSNNPVSFSDTRNMRASRLVAREVDAAVAENRLQVLRESVECENGSVAKQATLFTDAAGKPRKYALEGQTRGSAHYVFYYYDTAGSLRLIDSDQRIGEKSQRTSHLYYDRDGKLVHKDEKVSGPRAPFDEASERRDPASDIRTLADPRDGCRRVSKRR
jgi:hypothetical protein